jgi:hypothetical protein
MAQTDAQARQAQSSRPAVRGRNRGPQPAQHQRSGSLDKQDRERSRAFGGAIEGGAARYQRAGAEPDAVSAVTLVGPAPDRQSRWASGAKQAAEGAYELLRQALRNAVDLQYPAAPTGVGL